MKLGQLTRKRWAVKKQGVRVTKMVHLPRAFVAQGNLYQVKKHSTRSKYTGYYIVEIRESIINKETKVAKNLTKSQAVAWVQLLRS